jgi:hypothetical protein
MVDPQVSTGVKQVPEPLSTRNRNRVPKLSTRSRSHSVKYEPGSYTGPTPCQVPVPALQFGSGSCFTPLWVGGVGHRDWRRLRVLWPGRGGLRGPGRPGRRQKAGLTRRPG